MSEPLEIFTVPLQGINLVEASAGTGKTWAITGLYVRLILELDLRVEQILVVTYTKAATAELRDRIRKRLIDVLTAFKEAQSQDSFCRRLLDDYGDREQRTIAVRRLNNAIRGFDEAAVYTIHGFCQRVLNDSPFESGIDFEFELLPNETALLSEIVDDFWRRDIVSSNGIWMRHLVERKQSPDQWTAELRPFIGKPYLEVLPLELQNREDQLEDSFLTTYRKARTLWTADHKTIQALLMESEGLNRTQYRKTSLETRFREIEDYFRTGEPGLTPPGILTKYTPKILQKGCKKGHTPPAHRFFPTCEALLDSAAKLTDHLENRLTETKIRLLSYCNAELTKRKLKMKVMSYSDLLSQLAQALTAEHGKQLAKSIRSRYPSALIDEFQDTDPIQYDIFRSIYFSQSPILFYVGDPRQAIYAFRGADVFTYLRARKAAPKRYSLTTNQRSAPALIDALNVLYEASPAPFLLPEIEYSPAQPADKDHTQLVVEPDHPAALRFLVLPKPTDASGSAAPLTKADANRTSSEGIANEIVRLLNLAKEGKARFEGGNSQRPLNGGDIAVIVPTNHQGRQVQQALDDRSVPNVRRGQDNVFSTLEAVELQRILQAVAKPDREPLIKAALITELMGQSGESLNQLLSDDKLWESILEEFRTLHELWLKHGFIRMFRLWFNTQEIAKRLLGFHDGERRLTNLLHLAELLQIANRRKCGSERLLGWLSHCIHDPPGDDESTLLRLESDSERVNIVTIHSSKGLEYPVVMCPFLWDSRLRRKADSAVEFHDPTRGNQSCLDLGTEAIERHRNQALREEMAERLRLLYVALTRAKQRCYAVWGDIKGRSEGYNTSALAWLLQGSATHPDTDTVPEMIQRDAGKMGKEPVEQAILDLIAKAPLSITLESLPLDTVTCKPPQRGNPRLSIAKFSRKKLAPNWRMNSFSGFIVGRHSETPDRDEIDRSDSEGMEEKSMFAFPRGAIPGTCLHAIFEEWDFCTRDAKALHQLCEQKLIAHGIDPTWTPIVSDMIDATLCVPMADCGFKLGDLRPEQCIAELEFTFSLQNPDLNRLQQVLADPKNGLPDSFVKASRRLIFQIFKGYMKGFIDLVLQSNNRYYIIDYKSNWLGNQASNYDTPNLLEAMSRNHYYLQYLIYSVALHRFLKSRIPHYDYGQHFGGIFYLFLRGIAAGQSTGIFQDRPSPSLICALDGALDYPL